MPAGNAIRSRCPACAVTLRLRDDRGANSLFACPACHQPLRIVRDGLNVSLATAEASGTVQATEKSSDAGNRPAAPLRFTRTRVYAAVVGIALLATSVWLWLPQPNGRGWSAAGLGDRPKDPELHLQPARTAVPADNAANSSAETDGVEPVTVKLADLGARVGTYRQAFGHFPRVAPLETPRTGWWSWLAELELATGEIPAGRRPVNAKPWNDPANEAFVGRSVSAFLNPQVTPWVGEDGRPATHFVGVAGVGRDAPDFAIDHPRAGLFGWNRATRVEHVRDGLSNTLMVMGVESRLGSWADPGPSTIRPVTQPPYIHGPDGFGAGSPDAMPVLMADGSVRSITLMTDPLLVRRMAAMADGLPLDSAVPGELGDGHSIAPPTVAEPQTASVAATDPQSPEIVTTLSPPPEPARTVVTRPPAPPLLAQRLLSFQQAKPASRRQLLAVAEDLLGRSLVGDGPELSAAAKQQLDAVLTIAANDATVGSVLEQVFAGTDLDLIVGADHLTLHPRGNAVGPHVRIEAEATAPP